MIEAGQVCLKLPFLAALLPISPFANGSFADCAHHLCHHINFGMRSSLLYSRYCQEAGWAPRVSVDFCYGEIPLSLLSYYLELSLYQSRWCPSKLLFNLQSVYPIFHPAKKIILSRLCNWLSSQCNCAFSNFFQQCKTLHTLSKFKRSVPKISPQHIETNDLWTYSCSSPVPSFISLHYGLLKSR